MARACVPPLFSVFALNAALATSALAAGNVPQPEICDRACWGARSPSGSISQMSGLTRAVIHHTAMQTNYDTTSVETSKAQVRAVQNYHMDVNGWSDIGYHFLGDKLGNGFEGRQGSISSLPKGAHDGTNDKSFGFSMMGYLHEPYYQEPTVALRCQIYKMIAWRIPTPYTAYGSGSYGSLTGIGYLAGHRDVAATACPGDEMYHDYIGTDFYGGEARREINALITTGASPLCGGAEVCCPEAPTLKGVFNDATGNSVTIRWKNMPGVLSYRLYVSSDGVNFSSPMNLSPSLTEHQLLGTPAGKPLYVKLTAQGSTTESKPSDIYGARVTDRASDLLIVDGNDRWVTQTENATGGNHPFAMDVGMSIDHLGFDVVDNDALAAGEVSLSDYRAVIWLLGEESTTHETFSSAEQALVSSYLDQGGRLFVSGAEIGWDLSAKGSSADIAFYNTYLRAAYVGDDAGQYTAYGVGGGLFDGLVSVDFSPATMNVDYPDFIAPSGGSTTALLYGTTATGAGLVYDGAYQLVHLAFPIEAVGSLSTRRSILERVFGFFELSSIASVSAIDLSLEGRPLRREAIARVTVLDDLGAPVEGAVVTGTFSGAVVAMLTATTDSSGTATFSTPARGRGDLHFNFCVDDIAHDLLDYAPESNVESCQTM